MAVLGGGAVYYERGTPVDARPGLYESWSRGEEVRVITLKPRVE